MVVEKESIRLTKLLTTYNVSFWTEFYPAKRNLPLQYFFNKPVHPISLFIEFGLINTYRYNESGIDKLLLLMHSNCMFKNLFGFNFKQLIPKYLTLYDNYLGYSAFLIDINPVKDYNIKVQNLDTFCANISPLSKYFLEHDLFYQVNNNTRYACELIKKEIGNTVCDRLVPDFDADKETFRRELL